ncbi:Putative membrane-bound ClpP-class protease protein [Rhodovulum sp. PH10]|uniref:NfeD family protein n=1 Tax=Rhodovulum sp. PH10 TaxID=1187851 RepID=UPI00027C24F0|nr:nodulation protein NfeD [Rhodovulum sp. PH10]EJW12293.1 Putative membrane-bound ClpP-class protease protein [Rhodovulum sp. PH10]
MARSVLVVLALAVALVALLGPAAAQPRATSAAADGQGTALLIDVAGPIGPAAAAHVTHGLAEAEARGAAVLVLRLDTPGGLASSMREIVQAILRAPLPVIAFVGPSGVRAASAGTHIVYASHLAAMAPSTHLGAATPVSLGGGGLLGSGDEEKTKDEAKNGETPKDAHTAKAVNDAVAAIRGLAELRGRNADWAERAVRGAETLTAAAAAKERQVIEIVARDVPDLLAQADGRTVRLGDRDVTLATRGLAVVPLSPDWRTRLLGVITDPNIAYVLLLIGLYGLLFEALSPGAAFPGVIGGISLLVALYALDLLPISYAGAGLLLLGVALMVAEAFLPSFGALGIGGVVAFAAGSLFLFDPAPGVEVGLSWPVVAVATLATAGFLTIALAAAWRAHRRAVVTGEQELIGATAEVLRWETDHGDVHVHGEIWRALSATPAPLAAGAKVRITGRTGLTLRVEPAPPASRAVPP